MNGRLVNNKINNVHDKDHSFIKIAIALLKETHNSYICVTPKDQSLQETESNKSKNTN